MTNPREALLELRQRLEFLEVVCDALDDAGRWYEVDEDSITVHTEAARDIVLALGEWEDSPGDSYGYLDENDGLRFECHSWRNEAGVLLNHRHYLNVPSGARSLWRGLRERASDTDGIIGGASTLQEMWDGLFAGFGQQEPPRLIMSPEQARFLRELDERESDERESTLDAPRYSVAGLRQRGITVLPTRMVPYAVREPEDG